MESSLCEKPNDGRFEETSHHSTFEGLKQKVHSLVDTVGQPCLTDPFSPQISQSHSSKRECGKTARSVVCPAKAGMFSRRQTCR